MAARSTAGQSTRTPRPGPVGRAHQALAVGADDVERAVLEGRIGRRLLEPAAVAVGQHEVQVGRLGQRVAPALELAARAVGLGQRHDLAGRRDAAGDRGVDAGHAPGAHGERRAASSWRSSQRVAGRRGSARWSAGAARAIALEVGVEQRRLEPASCRARSSAPGRARAPGGGRSAARRRASGHDALGPNAPRTASNIGRSRSGSHQQWNLTARKPSSIRSADVVDIGLGRRRAAACWRRTGSCRRGAAEQLIKRQAGRLGRHVPERDVDQRLRPAGPAAC